MISIDVILSTAINICFIIAICFISYKAIKHLIKTSLKDIIREETKSAVKISMKEEISNLEDKMKSWTAVRNMKTL